MTDLEKLISCLEKENPDGYCDEPDGGISLQFSKAILIIQPDHTWKIEDFGIETQGKRT